MTDFILYIDRSVVRDGKLAELKSTMAELVDFVVTVPFLVLGTVSRVMEISLPTGEQPFALDRDEGEAVWFLGTLTIIKATDENTQGSFSLIEQLAPDGFGPPRHVHDEDDELFYIIDGEVEFESDDLHTNAGPGTTVYLPHGVPHAWRTMGETRLLQCTFKPGFEEFFVEMGTPADRLELPPEPEQPPDTDAIMNRMGELGEQYGFELLGPPLGTG